MIEDSMRRHASSLAHFRLAKLEILRRLQLSGVDHSIVTALQAHTECTFCVDIPGTHCSKPAQRKDVENSFYLKLPFHDSWSVAIDTVLRKFSSHIGFQSLCQQHLGSHLNFNTAWCLRDPTLANLVSVL